MAVRIDAVGDTLTRSANLPSNTSFTVCGWSRIVVNQGSVTQPLFYQLDAGATDGIIVDWGNTLGNMALGVSDGGSIISTANFASRPAAGADFHWYVKCSGTGSNLVEAGWRAQGDQTYVVATATLGATVAGPANYYFGGVLATYYANKRVQNVKVWDRALSAAELLAESYARYVVNPQNLNFWWPLDRADQPYDYSGKARHPTVSGLTTEPGVALQQARPKPRKVLYRATNAYTMTAASGSFTLTGNAAALTAQRKLAAATQSFTLTGNAARLARGYTLAASSGTFTLTGQAAALTAARKMAAASGTFTLTGNAAGLAAARKLTASSASFTLTGQDAGLKAARVLTAASGSFALTGNDATLTYSAAGKTLTADAGTFVLTGNPAALSVARKLTADSGSFTLTGQDAALSRSGYRLVCATGTFTLTGFDAELSTTGAVEPPAEAQTPAGASRSRQRRKFVQVDGQVFEVRDAQHAMAILDRARELAEKSATESAAAIIKRIRIAPGKKIRPIALKVPKLVSNTVDVTAAQTAIRERYAKAAQEAELKLLIELAALAQDEEEALSLLL